MAEEARNDFQRAGAGVFDAEMKLCGGHCRYFFEGVVKSRSWHSVDGFYMSFLPYRFKLSIPPSFLEWSKGRGAPKAG